MQLAGTWFSIPSDTYKEVEEGFAKATSTASSSKVRSTFSALGIEPGHWLTNPTQAGTTTISGVPVVHLTAAVDIPAFLADVSKLSQAGGALGLASSGSTGSVSPTVVNELAKSIKSAHVDVYTGQSDHLLRRLEVTAEVTGTSQTQALLGGLSSASLKVLLEFSDLNTPQSISAPANPEPASQLLPALSSWWELEAPAAASGCSKRFRADLRRLGVQFLKGSLHLRLHVHRLFATAHPAFVASDHELAHLFGQGRIVFAMRRASSVASSSAISASMSSAAPPLRTCLSLRACSI